MVVILKIRESLPCQLVECKSPKLRLQGKEPLSIPMVALRMKFPEGNKDTRQGL